MVNRGHDLQALLHDYPIDLVLNLHRAAMENQKDELKSQVLGFSIAVNNALDLAMGGKGKALNGWLKAMDGLGIAGEDKAPRKKISPEAMAFFGNSPVVVKTKD